jgi:hypothetical protein
MLNKKDQRIRRSRQTRARIAVQRVARLTVHRTNLHIYASVISDDGQKVLASASTAEKEVREQLGAAARVATPPPRRSSAAHRREGEGRRHRARRLRPRRLPVPRPRQGAGRRGPRSRPAVLTPATATS